MIFSVVARLTLMPIGRRTSFILKSYDNDASSTTIFERQYGSHERLQKDHRSSMRSAGSQPWEDTVSKESLKEHHLRGWAESLGDEIVLMNGGAFRVLGVLDSRVT